MRFEDLAPGPAPQLPQEVFEARRRRVADALGENGALVVSTHAPALHSHDVEHRFRPQNDFWYLTGFNESNAVLVLRGGTGETHLFLREREPKAEIWNGRRLGVERARDALGVDHAHPIETLGQRLEAIVKGLDVHAIVDHDTATAETVRNVVAQRIDGAGLVAAQRCIKDAQELTMLQRANDIGMDAQRNAFAHCRSGNHEFNIEAELLRTYRAAGSTGPGYPAIVGAGANASVLHYVDNNAPIRSGDLVLMDAGCEWGYYNSDITRTVPADGLWTSQQRELYGVVLAAHAAALAQVKPGNRFRAPHDAAVRVLAEGLCDLGIIAGDVDACIADETYRAHFMHGTSHFLGLDVHDAGGVRDERGESRLLEPGMVLTVEPGLYFNPDFARVPDGFSPLGIRIEDDLVVTEDGHRNLTQNLPRDPDDLAELVRSPVD